ncbi:MAG: translation initiation factor IF-2 [Gemmatimonadetes bacterium]|nr:translation initiation factor IF-2 [Gemmatimonadota bacterium]
MSLLAKTTGKTTVKKKRVYEIAREFNLSSVAMVEQIRSLGFEVKNHMAICTTEMVEAVQKKFDSERQATRRKLRRKDDEKKEREIREQKPRVSRLRSVQSDKKTETGSESRQRPRRRRRRTDYPTVIVEDVSQTPVQQEPKTKTPKTKEEKPVAKEDPKPKAKPVQEKRSRTRPPRKRRRRRKRPVVDEREVSENVRRTLAQMSSGAAPSRVRRRRRQDSEKPEDETTDWQVLKVNEFTTIGELASQMDVRPTEVITQCLKLGMVVTINQRLDMDTITLVADEFGFGVEELEEYGEEVLAVEVEVPGDSQKPRPPVVTIMGHVDHGKTSLLDYIRETNVMEGEAGGITQHIGAYHVELGDGREICFLDTPGHEAFTAMRARGASVTDVVVLVVAADDSVMPQTVEAIDHAKAANVPLVVAINKIDLPTSDPDKIKRELTEHNVIVEDYGGSVQVCEISAKTGQNIDALLELLALETEMLELVADPDKRARGTIVESKLDRGRGNVATVLVQEGRLQVGDPFITGMFSGRVRAMLDERGISVTTAGPSRPVQVLGLAGLPQAGDTFHVVENEREARDISQKRQQLRREQEFHRVRRVSLSDIHNRIETGNMEELRLIIKGDVDGSVEALQDALLQIEHEEVHLSVIHRAVGAISESDILLASASDAIIIGFNVRPDANAREVAAQERVDIRLYRVIYEVVEDIRAALSGLLAPKIEENVQGEAQVRELFQVPSVGTIAGCLVSQGIIHRTTNARVLRDGVIVYEGRIGSLRRFKDDVREVQNGFECGIGIENFNDVKVGDVIETYELVETTRSI